MGSAPRNKSGANVDKTNADVSPDLGSSDGVDAVHTARLENIRMAIENGNYQVDAEVLSDAIIRKHIARKPPI